MLDIVTILKTAQVAIESRYSLLVSSNYFEKIMKEIDFTKFIDVFVNYIESLRYANLEQYANDKLLMAKTILLQDEQDKKLKVTRVMTHLEEAYVILKRQKENTLTKKNKEKVQYTIDKVCCGLAVLHKLMGNSPATVKKYIIDSTSLRNPDKDYLRLSGRRNSVNYILSSEDLQFLLTKEQYNEYISFYREKIPYIPSIRDIEQIFKL